MPYQCQRCDHLFLDGPEAGGPGLACCPRCHSWTVRGLLARAEGLAPGPGRRNGPWNKRRFRPGGLLSSALCP